MHERTRLKEKQKDSDAMAKSHNILWLREGWVEEYQRRTKEHIFIFVFDFLHQIIQCKHMYVKRKANRKFTLFKTFNFISFILYRIIINVFAVAIFYAWNLLRSLVRDCAWPEIYKHTREEKKEV